MPKLKKGYLGASCACTCGGSGKYLNDRRKTLVCLFGDLRVTSPYYHCPTCHEGQKPWEQKLRIGTRRVTAAAAEAISLAGLLTSFGRAQRETLTKLTGIRISESTVQRVTEDAGEALAQSLATKHTFGPDKSWKWQRDARQDVWLCQPRSCERAATRSARSAGGGSHGGRGVGVQSAVGTR